MKQPLGFKFPPHYGLAFVCLKVCSKVIAVTNLLASKGTKSLALLAQSLKLSKMSFCLAPDASVGGQNYVIFCIMHANIGIRINVSLGLF